MTTMLLKPEYLQFQDAGGVHFGCDQDWFRSFWQRKAGCGPCTGAHILHYFQQSGRVPRLMDIRNQQDFIHLMEHSWGYLTPGIMGLNSPYYMQKGLDQMLRELGSSLKSQVMEIPSDADKRPDVHAAEAFIRKGLAADSPVAFLNLHNGGIHQLETWHWVTVVGLSGSGERAVLDIYDNGNNIKVNLSQWLKSTTRGGGFVYAIDSQE